MKEYSLLGRSGLAWQSSLPKLQKNNIQAKVTTLRTEMKSKACSFLRKETASSQTSNNVTELYLFFLQSWFHLCGGADNTTTSDIQATGPTVFFNVKYYECTLCLRLQSFNDAPSPGGTIFPRRAAGQYFGRNQCSAKAH